MKVFKSYEMRINNSLIPLKLALFFWYGAGSFMPSFLTVLLKQRGVSLIELSTMAISAPIIQFLGTAVTGIVADKTGRSKPVFVVNLLLVTTIIAIILLVPKIENGSAEPLSVERFCNLQQSEEIFAQTKCHLLEENVELLNCQIQCSNILDECNVQNNMCNMFDVKDIKNISITSYVDKSSKTGDSCSFNISLADYQNISMCDNPLQKINCTMPCNIQVKQESYRYLLIIYGVLFVLYLTTYSNCYRCMDVTAMFLVKEHNADYGRQRFFAMSGGLIIPPLAGYATQLATVPGSENNYSAALLLFIAMNFILFIIIYFIPVQVNPPGEKMWRKSLSLLKNPDVSVFYIQILALGTSWNFGKYFLFWYLEEMNAPSLLIGLITSVGALYGLPFLFTSKWWIKKLGPSRIILSAFLGYVINGIGYSFLRNLWLSLVLEATNIITYHLLWVAVIERSHAIAPEGLTSTIIAISGAIHYSIGKATSGLVGGIIMNKYGGITAFRFIAVLCLSSVILHALYVAIKRRCLSEKHELPSTDTAKP